MVVWIDTRKVAEYRTLQFETVDDCITEVRRLAEAERAGKLRASGNWTVGQVFSHIAAWIEYGYEGFPIRRPPWFIRVVLRWQLRKMLDRGTMPRGVRIPGVEGGTTGADDLPIDEAEPRLLKALGRLRDGEPAVHASPAFGPMSEEDRARLNLRHAELHLGYLRVEGE